MESGLLSTFHDDHFDGNYSKYENNLDLWSDGDGTMGLQLSETLHGILPIAATEEASHFFETELEHRIPYRFASENDGLTETIIEMDKDDEEEGYVLTNYDAADDMCDSMSPSIEIISVDPNCDFTSPVTVDDDDDDEDDEDASNVEDDESNDEGTASDRCSSRNSEYSNSNSDVSSIADYESHSSDESDNEDVATDLDRTQIQVEPSHELKSTPKKVETNYDNSLANTVPATDIITDVNPIEKKSHISSLSISESDPIFDGGEVVDMKNFDLATFITTDDYVATELNNILTTVSLQHSKPSSNNIIVNSLSNNLDSVENIKIESKCDSDTEAIIDIETVHENEEEDVKPMLLRKPTVDYNAKGADLNESFTQCDDDVKHDPSWSPNNGKPTKGAKTRTTRLSMKTKRGSNLMTKCNRMMNNSYTPNQNPSNKSHAVMDRKKYGLGKGKNISMCTKPELSDFSDSDIDCNAETEDDIRKRNMLPTKDKPDETVAKNTTKQPSAIVNSNEPNKNIEKLNQSSPPSNSKSKIIPNLSIVKNESAKFRIPKIEVKVEASSVAVSKPAPDVLAVKKEEPIVAVKKEAEDTPADKNDQGEKTVAMEVTPSENNNCQVPNIVVPVKKKLNLEEYKRRRENQLIGDTKIKKCIPCIPMHMPIPANNKKSTDVQTNALPDQNNSKTITPQAINNSPHPVNNAKQPTNKKFLDPILEAKNKVLRMQELKKAAQSKRIDSTVSSKVGPITPILPLEQICNKNYKAQSDASAKFSAEYEEIIIVSASCNTEISLPPVFEKLDPRLIANSTDNHPLTAVMKSSSLLSNISDTMKKSNTVKLTSSSLLSSIQDVVLKQSTTTLLNGNQLTQKSPNVGVSPPSQFSPEKPEMSHTDEANALCVDGDKNKTDKDMEHGEDKIIMHLRKDRIRKKTFTIAIQTDTLPQFPPLVPLVREKDLHSRSMKMKKRKRHYRSRRNSSAMSSDDNDQYRSSSRSHARCRSVSSHGTNRSVSPRSSRYSYSSGGRRTASPYHKIRRRSSRSSSRTKYASDSSTESDTGRRSRSRERRTRRYSSSHSSSSSSSSSGSSRSRGRSRSIRSRTRSRSRSRSHYSYGNRQRRTSHRRNSSPAVEERRIVYVGRIERETSKEDLKRKFCSYGPIKQITVHYKDTGMKYGFVTYEKAEDAYRVIDSSAQDSKVNMYDISFGGRRAFCRATYSDLDGAATNSLQNLGYQMAGPPRAPVSYKEDSFESLLAKVKEKLSSTKSTAPPSSSSASTSSRCKT